MLSTELNNTLQHISTDIEEMKEPYTTHDEIYHHAFMLTQYAKYGCVSLDELNEYIRDEIMSDPTVDQVNEYLSDNCYEEYFYPNNPDELNEMLYGMKPDEIVRATFYGSYSYADDYVTFNAYGNLESCNETDIIDDYGKATKEYLINTGCMDDEAQEVFDNSDAIILACNELLKAGY